MLKCRRIIVALVCKQINAEQVYSTKDKES